MFYIVFFFFFFNDTATTEIYTLSLHDALPICSPAGSRGTARVAVPSRRAADSPREDSVLIDRSHVVQALRSGGRAEEARRAEEELEDRKSTRLNSSHANTSYAVFCLKNKPTPDTRRSHAHYPHLRRRHQ